jgi:hypothetical protein
MSADRAAQPLAWRLSTGHLRVPRDRAGHLPESEMGAIGQGIARVTGERSATLPEGGATQGAALRQRP